jgi:hypothetical protein
MVAKALSQYADRLFAYFESTIKAAPTRGTIAELDRIDAPTSMVHRSAEQSSLSGSAHKFEIGVGPSDSHVII